MSIRWCQHCRGWVICFRGKTCNGCQKPDTHSRERKDLQ